MKFTEKVTTPIGETFTERRYLTFREMWGQLELNETEYFLMLSEQGELVINKTFESRKTARNYALKHADKYNKPVCFTIIKNNKIIERMEI